MTDYKQLCVELVRVADALDGRTPLTSNQGQALDGYSSLAQFRYVADRARTALAEPEPEWPTDEEIMELMPQQMRDDLAAAARALAGFDPDNIKAASVFRIILNRHFVDHSRAVLARWGNHPASPDSSLQPVLMSERLQQVEDLAADTIGALRYIEQVHGRLYGVGWDRVYEKADRLLPAHALPVPS